MSRPRRLVVVTGTGTEIGKTWVTAALIRRLQEQGQRVGVRKPAQSFAPEDTPVSTDAAVLGAASGETPTDVCPPRRWYPVALAPPMAAEALGQPPFTLADLHREVTASWPADPLDVGLVEGAGGVASPQAVDGDMRGLIGCFDPNLVVLVADAALGTLNLVRLSLEALAPRTVAVFLNRYDGGDDLHRRNRQWLDQRDRIAVTTELAVLARWVLG